MTEQRSSISHTRGHGHRTPVIHPTRTCTCPSTSICWCAVRRVHSVCEHTTRCMDARMRAAPCRGKGREGKGEPLVNVRGAHTYTTHRISI